MTLLVDPPAWPAHGRLWSHLVSDTSLHELRAFARAHDIRDRAFDHDHYDVPDARYDDLVAAGAVPVDGGELARRLGTSVLRVPGWERRRASQVALHTRWRALWRPAGGTRGALDAVGQDLVDRWREPHRTYHTRLHLADALDSLDVLAEAGAPGDAWHAAVALWFHDAVHDGEAGRDEERSADLAATALGPLAGRARTAAGATVSGDDVAEVARLVRLTAGHDPAPDDATGALVSDADLAVLGSDPRRYARYAAQVRAEYGHVPDADFRAGRAAVLTGLLAAPALYRTAPGRDRWADLAGRNLRAELGSLRGRVNRPRGSALPERRG